MNDPSKILVVDDQFLLALDVANIVEKQGHEVQGPFSTVEKALSHVAQDPPDTAILDINMGGGSTTEPIARALMTLGIPFAFLTGYGSKDTLGDAFPHIERLAKPAMTRDVIQLIERLLGS